MTWRDARLGDLIEIKHGFAFEGQYFTDDGPYVLLTPGNFADEGGYKARGDRQKHYDGPVPRDYVLKPGDLLVAMTEQAEGLLGSAAWVPSGKPCLHNQRLGLVRAKPPAEVDLTFVYYLFNSRPVRQQIRASASGAKVRHTSPGRIYEVAVSVPPLDTQRRIAGILSAYDDLIENNERRIAILEDMARRVFREWFVDFRFPGHEAVRMVNTEAGRIPEGWKRSRLGDIAHLTMGQSPPSHTYNKEGVGLPFHQGVTDFGQHFPTDRVYCSAIDGVRHARNGDILFSVRAPVGRINVALGDLVLGRGVAAIRPQECVHFLLEALRDRFAEDDQMGHGTIFKAVTKSDVASVLLTWPTPDLRQRYEVFAASSWSQIRTLALSNRHLRATRDLLLPRLVSGELLVSAAEPLLEAAE